MQGALRWRGAGWGIGPPQVPVVALGMGSAGPAGSAVPAGERRSWVGARDRLVRSQSGPTRGKRTRRGGGVFEYLDRQGLHGSAGPRSRPSRGCRFQNKGSVGIGQSRPRRVSLSAITRCV